MLKMPCLLRFNLLNHLTNGWGEMPIKDLLQNSDFILGIFPKK